MKQTPVAASELIPLLNLPIPPMLEEALGYEGEGRCVAFWWEPAGGELCYSDGQRTLCGAEWYAWLLYTRHPRVEPYLMPYSFGSSDEEAQHALLIDRWERNAYVGNRWAVTDFLDRNLPQNLPAFPGIDSILANLRFPGSFSPEELQAMRERQRERWDSMVAWLDQGISSGDK